MSTENVSTENVNTEAAETQKTTPAANTGESKTFTQEDVNRIVQDRLAKDRARAAEEMGKREQELKEREFRLNSRQKLIDRGLPENIMDALNCSSEEAFNRALDTIDSLIRERTPSAEQQELEKNMARFTAPMSGGEVRTDHIREAMRL